MLFGEWKTYVDKYDIVIISATIYSEDITKYIQKKTSCRIIHWYWNPVIKSVIPNSKGTELWSFDEDDCKKNNMNYISTYYFSSIKLTSKCIIYDIYFVGEDKGRLDELLKLKKLFKEAGLRVNMHITESKESTDRNFSFQHGIPYEEVLERISESKAILDIVQTGQKGISQRPMESLFFKKKLVTNDKDIAKHDFYNKNNIFILGNDNIQDLNNFINSKYENIDKNIVDRYDFSEWIERISSYKGN
jgi:hypothetical protein